jgi:hypothetical protein
VLSPIFLSLPPPGRRYWRRSGGWAAEHRMKRGSPPGAAGRLGCCGRRRALLVVSVLAAVWMLLPDRSALGGFGPSTNHIAGSMVGQNLHLMHRVIRRKHALRPTAPSSAAATFSVAQPPGAAAASEAAFLPLSPPVRRAATRRLLRPAQGRDGRALDKPTPPLRPPRQQSQRTPYATPTPWSSWEEEWLGSVLLGSCGRAG